MRRSTSFRDQGGIDTTTPPPPPSPPNLLILAGFGPPPPQRPDISGKKAQNPSQYIFCFKAKETPAGKIQLS